MINPPVVLRSRKEGRKGVRTKRGRNLGEKGRRKGRRKERRKEGRKE